MFIVKVIMGILVAITVVTKSYMAFTCRYPEGSNTNFDNDQTLVG